MWEGNFKFGEIFDYWHSIMNSKGEKNHDMLEVMAILMALLDLNFSNVVKATLTLNQRKNCAEHKN